jgi:hypothetical protein
MERVIVFLVQLLRVGLFFSLLGVTMERVMNKQGLFLLRRQIPETTTSFQGHASPENNFLEPQNKFFFSLRPFDKVIHKTTLNNFLEPQNNFFELRTFF